MLGISQPPGGLALCAALLERHFSGRWVSVDVVACFEAGGFVYASALAARMDVPLALISEAGKLPPPTMSVVKSLSYISSSASNHDSKARIEMGRDTAPKGVSVLVVDDVLATGRTSCGCWVRLASAPNVSVIVVAEFPVHHGRELPRRHGFSGVNVQSLLVFGGA